MKRCPICRHRLHHGHCINAQCPGPNLNAAAHEGCCGGMSANRSDRSPGSCRSDRTRANTQSFRAEHTPSLSPLGVEIFPRGAVTRSSAVPRSSEARNA